MILHKWGKFKREEKYSEGYREVLVKSCPKPSMDSHESFDYISSWIDIGYDERRQMFYWDYEIKNGTFVGISHSGFSGPYVILGPQSLSLIHI